jgi:hypothetical protein
MTGSRIPRRVPLLLLLTAAVLCASVALAGPRRRRVGLSMRGDVIRASFSYRDVFNKQVRKKLDSGLPVRVVVQLALERKGKDRPYSYWARSVEIVYDLWEEDYVITMEDDRGRRRTRVGTIDEAINLAGVLWRVRAAHLAGLRPGTYRFRVLAEVNPVSKEMVENIRRWLSRPSGGQGSEARSNFFGSFVGIFVDRRIGEADKSVAFVSQWFQVGAR